MPFKVCTNSQAVCIMWGHTSGFPINKLAFSWFTASFLRQGANTLNALNTFIKWKNEKKSFSSHALHGSYTNIKISDNPTQWNSVAPSETFTIIYILFSIKVFLLVTKHKPEAIEQQGELQNDGSLNLAAPRSLTRRKTRKLIKVWQLLILWFTAFSLKHVGSLRST